MPEPFLGDGLIFEETMPLAWTPGPPADEATAARFNSDNHQLLIADSTLDEVRVHDALKDESPALVHELQRLDYKLNILLRLTAELAMRQSELPRPRAVRLSARGLEWVGDDIPEMGSTGLLTLYVNPMLPQPLKLAACVAGERVQNNVRAAQMRFTGLSEPVVELIEKFIFRHHRRRVAGSKAASSIPN